jgi:hypothetical protein
MIRVRVGRHVSERYRVVGRTLDLAAGVHAAGVAIDQQAQQPLEDALQSLGQRIDGSMRSTNWSITSTTKGQVV